MYIYTYIHIYTPPTDILGFIYPCIFRSIDTDIKYIHVYIQRYI